MDFVWGLFGLALCAGLGWLAFRMEPHWVSKDGERMLCAGQPMSAHGDPLGRWRETRVALMEPGHVQVEQKQRLRRSTSYWRIERQSDAPVRGKTIFLLRASSSNEAELLAIRLPAKSRAVVALQDHLAQRSS
jgi:hypothetical protein